MIIIIATMTLGIITGYISRHNDLKRLGSVITGIIWMLLFLLGVEAGSNDRIIQWFASLGCEALLISIGSVAGSACFALLLWKVTCSHNTNKETTHER